MHESSIRLYTDLARWFHLLTRPEDYAEEAGIYTRVIHQYRPDARYVLEMGCGGGNNASHMKGAFNLTLTDLSADMLEISQELNPGLPHFQGDMRTLRLDQRFDAVFVHDAVMYLTSEDDLRAMMMTAALHLHPGGVLLICPDCTTETFQPGTDLGGHDGANGFPPQYADRALRYLFWNYDPDPSDTTFTSDGTYLLREDPDRVTCVYDRHLCGLFPRATWISLLEQVGFQASVEPFDHSEVSEVTEMFIGVMPEYGGAQV